MIRMVTQPDCPWCERAEALSTSLGIPLTKTCLDTPEKKQAFKSQGFETVPQIYVNGYLVGGFDAFQAIASGALLKLYPPKKT